MLIGISGSEFSGKHILEQYLRLHGFKLLEYPNPGSNIINNENDNERNNDEGDNHENEISPPRVFKKFKTFDELYEYVTLNWKTNYVISNINNLQELDDLQKRPFFLHISVDATISKKYEIFLNQNQDKQEHEQEEGIENWQKFINYHDSIMFNKNNSIIEINNKSQVKILLKSSSIIKIYEKFDELSLWDPTRLRPNWDSYFMKLSNLAALRSNCMKRRVGCVIVKENRVIATGYNGTPRHLVNCNDGGCDRCNLGQSRGDSLSTCLCLHAEENALLEAGRDRIGNESILYCNTCPCLTCSVKIAQIGIKEVVYDQSYSMDLKSHKILSDAKIILRQFKQSTYEIII